MDYYLIKQYDSEDVEGNVRNEGFAAYPSSDVRATYFDPAIDFLIYVAM